MACFSDFKKNSSNGSAPPHAEASLGSKEFNPKIPIESEECNSMPPNGKSCWFPVGYRGEALLSVGADIWFSPRAESGDELRPFDHNHKVVSANAHLCPPGKSS